VRIGVFGGSFDPVHAGHLIVAEAAAELLVLDQIRFIPARRQPFKHAKHHASPDDRVAMLQLALEGNPRFVLDRQEMRRDGPSYTVDTLEALHNQFPSDQLFLLVGADAARDLPKWREVDRFRDLATVVVLTRPDVSTPTHRVVGQVLTVPRVDVSATAIREAVRDGRSIRYLVPEQVMEYLHRHELYTDEG
jgi:nicotinate-nucleotide adenylyltransferase